MHKIWIENERPGRGIIAAIRRQSRDNYHNSVVQRQNNVLNATKMAESLCLNNVQTFWKMVRKLRNGNKTSSNMIDNVTGDEAISSLFAEKYEDIYNSLMTANIVNYWIAQTRA